MTFEDLKDGALELEEIITKFEGGSIIQAYRDIIRRASLSEEDTQLLEAISPYLAGVSLTARLSAITFPEKKDEIQEMVFSQEFVKDVFAFAWEKVKHLRPDLDDEAGAALVRDLAEKFGVAYKQAESIAEGKGEYRTLGRAMRDGLITSAPSLLANITLPGYESGVALLREGYAHLEPIKAFVADKLRFEDGVLFFVNDGGDREEFTEAHLRLGSTNGEGIEHINLPLLRLYYSAILKVFEEKVKEIQRNGGDALADLNEHLLVMPAKFYVPDLIEQLGGGKRNINKEQANNLISETMSFRHIVGVIYDYRHRASYFPVLTWLGYDATKNTITFASPYLGYLIRMVYEDSFKRNKRGEVVRNKRGVPALKPAHSYLVKSSIGSRRNKDAALTAMNIVTLVEQAGGKQAHIRASELVRRNPSFSQRLDRNTNKNQLLARHFSAVMEILQEDTQLFEAYKGLKLPEIKTRGGGCVITTANLNDLVLTFKHNGKGKAKDEKDTETEKT